MNVTTEPRDNRQLLVTIEVPQERVDAALAQAARRLSQKYKIPGFRPGKAPRDVVERMVGKQALLEEVVDDLGPKVYKEALETHNIEPYGMGEMEDFSLEPMVFKMVVPLAPIVDLGDYKSLRVPYLAPSVDQHEVEHQLEHIRENNAIVEPMGDDAVAESNMIATVDIEGKVDGETFIPKQEKVTINLYPPLDHDEDTLDFSAPIIGMRSGEDKTFSLTVPDTDQYEQFRGKAAEFQVHLHSLQKRELPALDDALAQTVGDYETLDALKSEIEVELLNAAIRQADDKYGDECINTLVKQATIEFAPQMIKSEVDELVERTDRRVKQQKMTMKDYLEALGKTEEQYREELKPTAEIRLKRGLALNEIVKQEGVSVDDEEVEQQIDRMAAAYGPQAKEARKAFSDPQNREGIKIDLLTQKAMKRLMAICKGEADKPAEEPAAA
ncbi:MAG TPA: trigger factor [Anaerolineae bacterium]|nr:trigger factor [Anaerolineae bacterium]